MTGLLVLGIIGLIMYLFHAIVVGALLKDIINELRKKK